MENISTEKKLKRILIELRTIEPAEIYREPHADEDPGDGHSPAAENYNALRARLSEDFGIKSKIKYLCAFWNNPSWYGSESCDFRDRYPSFWAHYVECEGKDEDELLEDIAGIGNDGETEHFVCEGIFSEFSIEKITEHQQDLINQIIEKMYPPSELKALRHGSGGGHCNFDDLTLVDDSFDLDNILQKQDDILAAQNVKHSYKGGCLSKLPYFTGSTGSARVVEEQFLDAAIFVAKKFLAANPDEQFVEIRSRNCDGVYRQKITQEET
jgi:hypothetical protein